MRAGVVWESFSPFSLLFKTAAAGLAKMGLKLVLDKLMYSLKAVILSPSWRLLLFCRPCVDLENDILQHVPKSVM